MTYMTYRQIISEKNAEIARLKDEIERVREEAIKQFGKMLIDKAERGIIHADDIPDYVVEMAGD